MTTERMPEWQIIRAINHSLHLLQLGELFHSQSCYLCCLVKFNLNMAEDAIAKAREIAARLAGTVGM